MSKRKRSTRLLEKDVVKDALKEAFIKYDPRLMMKNPVMFTVEIGTVVMLIVTIMTAFNGASGQGRFLYNLTITILLWLTNYFGNFAEAIAEARGKAQASSLRKTREITPAKILLPNGEIKEGTSAELKKGDVFIVEAGEMIPSDGEIIEGLASIDESAITGESAPVIREAETDHSGVLGGTRVLSDKINVLVTLNPADTFLDKMIA